MKEGLDCLFPVFEKHPMVIGYQPTISAHNSTDRELLHVWLPEFDEPSLHVQSRFLFPEYTLEAARGALCLQPSHSRSDSFRLPNHHSLSNCILQPWIEYGRELSIDLPCKGSSELNRLEEHSVIVMARYAAPCHRSVIPQNHLLGNLHQQQVVMYRSICASHQRDQHQ